MNKMRASEFRSIVLSQQQGKQGRGKAKPSKYQNKPEEINGIRFDSRKEARRYIQLLRMQQAGLIADLQMQVPIVLIGCNGPLLSKTGRKLKYVADFTYTDDTGAKIVEDVKSSATKTQAYKLKRAILASMGIEILET